MHLMIHQNSEPRLALVVLLPKHSRFDDENGGQLTRKVQQ